MPRNWRLYADWRYSMYGMYVPRTRASYADRHWHNLPVRCFGRRFALTRYSPYRFGGSNQHRSNSHHDEISSNSLIPHSQIREDYRLLARALGGECELTRPPPHGSDAAPVIDGDYLRRDTHR
jgi:hypothetical protein